MTIDEYDVTYSIKEWLIANSWNVLAFNPPGSQGTFSIPNPDTNIKKISYRGQTGTRAPDIIALKNNTILIVECKNKFYKIQSDLHKLIGILSNQQRVDILLQHVYGQCRAQGIQKPASPSILIAIGYGEDHLDPKLPDILKQHSETLSPITIPTLYVFRVTSTDVYWDNKIIKPGIRLARKFTVSVTPDLS